MPSTARKVRYGVVAGGSISQGAFMPGIGQTDNSEITVLVTGDEEKARQLGERYALRTYHYDQYAQMLAAREVDALYIATPNFRHREFVVPALEAGIHVLLEKPMGISEADCKAMIEASKRTGAKLMVAYRLHCEPGTLDMIERVHKGDFGDPRLFTSIFTQRVKPNNHRAQNGFEAGPVPDMGPYPLNMVRQLFNAEPIEVSAMGVRSPGSTMDTWDTVTSAIPCRLPSGSSYWASRASSRLHRALVMGKGWRSATGPPSMARRVCTLTLWWINLLGKLLISPTASSTTSRPNPTGRRGGAMYG
jgi:predicted dehydrogenase